MMTRRQKETYAIICAEKKYAAKGNYKSTCKVLMQLGLISPDPDSKDDNEYVLKGKPLNLPFSEKLPLAKDIIKEISKVPPVPVNEQAPEPAPKHKPIVWASPAIPPTEYSNVTREQHIDKWLSVDVKPGPKKIVPVKCLNETQMDYILANHKDKSAMAIADHLKVEKHSVRLFCQANDIVPKPEGKQRKKQDSFHNVPIERKQRMARIGYNGPQNKTA